MKTAWDSQGSGEGSKRLSLPGQILLGQAEGDHLGYGFILLLSYREYI